MCPGGTHRSEGTSTPSLLPAELLVLQLLSSLGWGNAIYRHSSLLRPLGLQGWDPSVLGSQEFPGLWF